MTNTDNFADFTTLEIEVTNNSVTNSHASGDNAILVEARKDATVCANIKDNTATTAGAGKFGIRLRQRDVTTFELERLTLGAVVSTATVIAHVVAENTATADATIATQFTGVPDGTCDTPSP